MVDSHLRGNDGLECIKTGKLNQNSLETDGFYFSFDLAGFLSASSVSSIDLLECNLSANSTVFFDF